MFDKNPIKKDTVLWRTGGEKEGEREHSRVFLFLLLDWTHSRTDHSIYFQVRMKGRLQTMHVVYSLVTLFKERKKDSKKSWKRVEGVERCINFTYTSRQSDCCFPKTFFFSPPENTFLAE